MVRRLLPFIVFLAGCSQVLGLDDYTNQEGGAPLVDAGCGLGLACADTPPAGWTGPVALWTGTGTPPPSAPDCAGAWGQKVYDGSGELSAPMPTCGCACVNLTGATCGAATLTRYSNTQCNALCGGNPMVVVAPGGCSNATPCGGNWDLGGTAAMGGSCTPQPSKMVPPATWTVGGRVCGSSSMPSQGSCDTGKVCVPLPTFPFAERLCIVHAGDTACPGGAYTKKHVFYDGFLDTRDCPAADCSCGAATGIDCNGTASLVTYDGPNCGGNALDSFSVLPKACQKPNIATKSVKLTATPSGGSCAPTTVNPSGTATPENPTTVCCRE